MAVRDQYYIPKSSESFQTTDVLDSEERVERRLDEMFNKDWILWEEVSPSEKNITILVHAPSSLLDMRRLGENDTGSMKLTDTQGNIIRAGGQGQELGLLPCRNFGDDWLTGYIKHTAEELGVDQRYFFEVINSIGRDYKPYGAFQPSHLGRFEDDGGVNPLLFSLAMSLKLRKEVNEHDQAGRICIVTHPDHVYFIANGDISKMKEVCDQLAVVNKFLGLEVFLENPIFANEVFREHFSWMEDPAQLADLLLPDSNTLGLCIDAKHLELRDRSGEEIDELLKEIIGKGYNLVLHIDSTFSATDLNRPYIQTAYMNALPIAYESRNGGFNYLTE